MAQELRVSETVVLHLRRAEALAAAKEKVASKMKMLGAFGRGSLQSLSSQEREEQERAAVKIQSVQRGKQTRKAMKERYEQEKAAIAAASDEANRKPSEEAKERAAVIEAKRQEKAEQEQPKAQEAKAPAAVIEAKRQ